MTLPFQPGLDFDASERASETGEALVVALDGFEGPLHLLLALARGQKVDLLQISIARLAEQYLAFVETQRRLNFGLAAEYLVMAAWLAYLKSRLLLPKPERAKDEEPEPEALADALAFRLAKLDAMRRAADALRFRPQMGRDVFGRGSAEVLSVRAEQAEATLYDLMSAYAAARLRLSVQDYRPDARIEAYPPDAARERLRSLLPELADWTPLAVVAPSSTGAGPTRASYLASTLSAGLEMTRDGALELRQDEAFAELYLRARRGTGP